MFALCVDDFGVQYCNKQDVHHLIGILSKVYKVTSDWTGKNVLGYYLDWNYEEGYLDISMPGYINTTLKRLQHVPTIYPQYSPHHYQPIVYGVKGTTQFAPTTSNSPELNAKETRDLQSAVGSLLYCACALDCTMLPTLNQIGSEQARPTQETKAKLSRLLDYAATYPEAVVQFYASNMLLTVDSDAAYLVLPKARSRLAGYFRLLDQHPTTPYNGAILVECKTIRHVVSSAAEAATHGVFHNANLSLHIRNLLQGMGHAQPPTTIKTDNSTAVGFVHQTIQQKASKAWDMQLHWLRDKENQAQFKLLWEKGNLNGADYFTKVTHPTVHHKNMRSNYVQDQLPSQHLNIIMPSKSYNCKGVLVPDISGTRIQSQDTSDVSMMSSDMQKLFHLLGTSRSSCHFSKTSHLDLVQQA